MKVLILANGESSGWTTWPQKIQAIKNFYAPVVALQIDLVRTSFTNVPIVSQPGQITSFGPNGPVDTAGTDLYVSADWRLKNIVPLGVGYDICIFQCDPGNNQGIPGGIFVGYGQVDTFIRDENSHAYQMGADGLEHDLGNDGALILIHEISHAFYFMLNKTDNTHKYFYAATPEKVLAEFVFPSQSLIISLLYQLIALLTKKRDALKNNMNTFPPKVVAWANAIIVPEGAAPGSNNPGNLKYSSLTASWGATQGRAASDGGHLCQFATPEAGFNALCNFLLLGCENQLLAFHSPEARTLAGFTKIYAGNPPQGYINAIEIALDVPGSILISTFLN